MRDRKPEANAGVEPRCPHCEYNVTGLPQPRCPECGREFTWREAWECVCPPPQIALERATGAGQIAGFVQTWLTVLALPWVFGKQAAKRISVKSGLIFGGVCFSFCWISALPGLFNDPAPPNFIVAWCVTGAVHVVTQTVVLFGLDWPHWRRWRESVKFWLSIGGYTSAIVVTEIVYGPPLVDFSSLPDLFSSGRGTFFSMPAEPWIHWSQIGAWLIGLACIMFARLRSSKLSRLVAAWITAVAVVAVYHLFVVSILFVGMRVGEMLGVK